MNLPLTPIFRSLPFIPATIASLVLVSTADAQFKYEVRAATLDRIPSLAGGSRQGSFGAPSINDRGAVSYACILFGNNIDATNSSSIAYNRSSRKRPSVVAQAGFVVDDSFAGGTGGDMLIPGSVRPFSFSRDVALNQKNQTAFVTETLYSTVSSKGVVTRRNAGGYGVSSRLRKQWIPLGVFMYISYADEMLRRTISISKTGAIGANATFLFADQKALEGIAFSGVQFVGGVPVYDYKLVTTVDTTVIGLPYFTEYQSFSEGVISDGNRLFIVADVTDDGEEFDGIWQGNSTFLEPVVVKTTNAPGGGKFTNFEGKIGASRNGRRVAFIADTTSGDRGVFRVDRDGGDLMRVISAGDATPGVQGSEFSGFELAAVNKTGQVVILGEVSGTTGRNRSGIWLSDKSGGALQLVALEGSTIDVRGTQKTITRLTFNPISGINSRGDVAFTASFTDRTSAVFVAKQ